MPIKRFKNISKRKTIRVTQQWRFHLPFIPIQRVAFFSHKCTRQPRQMPNNRRGFLPRHENAAVALYLWTVRYTGPAAGRGRAQRPLPFPSLPPLNSDCETTGFVHSRFSKGKNEYEMTYFSPYSSTWIFLSSFSQTFKWRHSDVRYYVSNSFLKATGMCGTGRSCLLEGWEISIISKELALGWP